MLPQATARWLELTLLFGLLPPLALAGRGSFAPWLLPALVVLSLLCLWLILQDPGFKRFRLVNAGQLWPALRRRRAAFLAGLAISALLYASQSDQAWFRLPAEQTASWLALLIIYPVFSVLPQELIFRTFFFHRYQRIIPRKRSRAWLSAAAFAWAHVIYGNGLAILLSAIGGMLFAFTYAKTRSTLACVVEHSLWGLWLFSFGLGQWLDSSHF